MSSFEISIHNLFNNNSIVRVFFKLGFTSSQAELPLQVMKLHEREKLIKLSWHFCSLWDKLGWLNWFWQFLCDGLSSFNPKKINYSYAWSCSLCERRSSFCTELISRKLSGFLHMFLADFASFSVLLLFPLPITFFLDMHGFWFYFI